MGMVRMIIGGMGVVGGDSGDGEDDYRRDGGGWR